VEKNSFAIFNFKHLPCQALVPAGILFFWNKTLLCTLQLAWSYKFTELKH